MKKPKKESKSTLLRAWETVVGSRTPLIEQKGPLMGDSWPNQLDILTIGPKEKWVSGGRSGEKEFFLNNLTRLVRFGVVFGGKFHGWYPWRYCDPSVAIPIDFALGMLKAEFGVEVSQAEILDLMKRGFLPKSARKGLPLFAKDRIIWIRECRKRFDYSDSHLKQLVEYEDQLMKYLSSSAEAGSYDECDCLNLASRKKRGVRPIGRSSGLHRKSKSRHQGKDKQLNQVLRRLYPSHMLRRHPRGISAFLAGKTNFRKLSKEDQEKIIFQTEMRMVSQDIVERVWEVTNFRESILGGYSPQIAFHPNPEFPPDAPRDVREARIDWTRSMENIKRLDIDFVRTPMFLLAQEKGEMIIKIFKPSSADSKIMREIEKIYTLFRKKRGVEKRGWGDVSGRKAQIAERDRSLREHFRKLRPSVPAAETGFQKLQEWMRRQGYARVSVERLKRIVYRRGQANP